ncbi:hypothetical protein [Methanosarcina sp.]|uniref:hypothetical protein n=1 Tax=Methanosarcina sp. TaxID=2213 RepID=UPI0029884D1C|nr:hypothetical protein [Methanosarcina sp.]MDW5550078.1 hypothetical protein [Methanosarcina sp.]MDW5554032.1 hypothetical protein [Methanosarcina sp.]MDW5558463.1 hypothetical protein [Methanosarcina sp.]
MVFSKKVVTVTGSAVPDMFGIVRFRLYLREIISFEGTQPWKNLQIIHSIEFYLQIILRIYQRKNFFFSPELFLFD